MDSVNPPRLKPHLNRLYRVTRRILISLLVAGGFGCASHGSNPRGHTSPPVTQDSAFLSPPGATVFCRGHVIRPPAPGAHFRKIRWHAHASPRPLESLRAYYRARHGVEHTSRPTSGRAPARIGSIIWRSGTANRPRVLSVHRAGQAGPWTRCKIPPGTQSVILLSSGT